MTDIIDHEELSDRRLVTGRVVSLDPGARRVGVAISDPNQIAVTRLPFIHRTSWKNLLHDVRDIVQRFDAKSLVIGLPLNIDGTESSSAAAAKDIARKFSLSLRIPVYLQDERLSSLAARENLQKEGLRNEEADMQIDSEAAAIILRDFLGGGQQTISVKTS